MPFHVYLLRCRDGSYYAGHTDALEPRLAQHRAGLASDWTKRRLPVELMWTDSAPTRDEALAFERRIKGWTRAKKEALIAGEWTEVSRLARPPRERPSTSLRTNGVGSGKKRVTASNPDRPELSLSDVPQTPVRPELSLSDVPQTGVRPELVEGRRTTAEPRPSALRRRSGEPSLRTNGDSSGKEGR